MRLLLPRLSCFGALTVSDVYSRLVCFQSTSTSSALEVLHSMRYINLRLTYLLTHACAHTHLFIVDMKRLVGGQSVRNYGTNEIFVPSDFSPLFQLQCSKWNQCCCPRGKSLSSRIIEDQFSSPFPCPRQFKSSKIVKDCVDYKTSVVSCEISSTVVLQ